MQRPGQLYSRRTFLQTSTAATAAGALALTLGRKSARAEVSKDASKEFQAIVAAVEEIMEALYVPGVALAVFARGREEIATFGVGDRASGELVTPSTRFQNGSITKTYTATAAMRLVQDGRLNIDVPVRSYIPELHLADARTADHVTVRHLLTHAGGWWGDGFIDNGSDDLALARFVADILPKFPQITPLGEYTTYNNAGISLLGRVIEVITGQTYRQAMQELVLDPLGLSNSTFDPDLAFQGSYARGYGPGEEDPAELVTPLLLPRNIDPAGGLWTDIRDQIRYGRVQLGDDTIKGPRVLDKAALTEMHTPIRAFGEDASTSIGWSWLVVTSKSGLRLITHDGATYGQAALLFVVPEAQFALAVLTNSQSGGVIGTYAAEQALKEYFGVGGGAGSPLNLKAVPPSEAELKQYLGRYEVPTQRYTISLEGGQVYFGRTKLEFMESIGPSNDSGRALHAPLTFVAPDTAILGSLEQPALGIGFERRKDNSIGWLKLGGRMIPKLG